MVVFGYHVIMTLYLILPVATGCIHLKDGRGRQTIAGAGHLSTMVAGPMIRFMDGRGFRVMNGVRHGFHGGPVVVITDGRQWLRV